MDNGQGVDWKNWKKLFKQGKNSRNALINCMNRFTSFDNAKYFANYIDETLKRQNNLIISKIALNNDSLEPGIPLPRLKRETIICNTKTIFQNKLSEVLFEDTMQLGGMNMLMNTLEKQIIDLLQNREHEIYLTV